LGPHKDSLKIHKKGKYVNRNTTETFKKISQVKVTEPIRQTWGVPGHGRKCPVVEKKRRLDVEQQTIPVWKIRQRKNT